MQRFKNILLLADGVKSKAAFDRAVKLAQTNQAHLKVVAVVDRLPHNVQTLAPSIHLSDLVEMVLDEEQEQLDCLIEPVRRQGIDASAKVLMGTPFLEIIKQVIRGNHDLVMLSAEGAGAPKGNLFGSTTMHLMRKCPCAIWAVKSSQPSLYSRVLAAIDATPVDDSSDALNNRILELSTSLARLEGSELHIIYAWSVVGEKLLVSRAGLIPAEVEERILEHHKQYKTWLNRLLEKHPSEGLNLQVHLLKGEASKLIPEIAGICGIELIVMGTVCRTGIAGFFIGNTSEEVLRQVDCSVLTVKPDGFVTPVKLDEDYSENQLTRETK
jgi:universal stress protein E